MQGLRKGIRDLSLLTAAISAFDPNSAAVIETVLIKIQELEAEQEIEEKSDLSMPVMSRQYSVGTITENSLISLKTKLSENDFSHLLLLLKTIVRHIKINPTDEKYRTLRKNNPMFSMLTQSTDAQNLMHAIGFSTEMRVHGTITEESFVMKLVKADKMTRVLSVINTF